MAAPPSIQARRQLALVAVAAFVVFGVIAIAAGVWFVTSAADPVRNPGGPSSFDLARRVRKAHLGCTDPSVVADLDAKTFDASFDETECDAAQSHVLFATFVDQQHAESAMHTYLCLPPSSARPNHTFVLGDHWIAYPTTASAVGPIQAALGGAVSDACVAGS